jgi:hypothetical protein
MRPYIKKQSGMIPELIEIPANQKVLVFGKLSRNFVESEGLYLAFLANQDANISPPTKILEVKHLQCFEGECCLQNVNINFSASRAMDGGYCFESKWHYRYDFFPPNKKIDHPTGFLNCHVPIEVFFILITD